MRYIDGIRTIKADEPDNALFLGTALHTGLEKGVDAAINEYFMQYPVITDAHINEAIKLETMIPKAKAMIPKGQFEVEISDDDFKGFIDLLAPVTSDTRIGGDYQELPNLYDLYDFKYSNNVSHYKDSVQVHLYKYFFEKLNPGKKIRNLFYLCVPKVNIKQKKKEDLNQFRQRIQEELTKAEPNLIQVEYDQSKVLDWVFRVKHTIEAVDFPKNESWLCRYCEFNDYCQKGENFMILPKNERRNIETIEKKLITADNDIKNAAILHCLTSKGELSPLEAIHKVKSLDEELKPITKCKDLRTLTIFGMLVEKNAEPVNIAKTLFSIQKLFNMQKKRER